MISDIRATDIKEQSRLKLQDGGGVQSTHATWDVMSIQRFRSIDSRCCVTSPKKKKSNMKKTEKQRNFPYFSFSHFEHQPAIPCVPRMDAHGGIQTHNPNAFSCAPAPSTFLKFILQYNRKKMG